ncbi:short chain dehydrogenase/reductase [Microthyrium microscopicum]|uniref:Short chain dehydrogenase/reductase n=1 Tax=Microthyrium microscopicum TaxID=703497 RepID=A0A6A6UPW6_9PEZI|nr:short chain dehydrogenase/reductase [Microthyrium microscopicum]
MSPTIVLITGANSGIGCATAKVFASSSSDYHIIVAGRNLKNCETAVSEIKASGVKGNLTTLLLDVTSQESVDTAASEVEKQFGRLDVLINNAGISDTTLTEVPEFKKRLDAVLTTNITGPAIVSLAFRHLLFKSSNAYSIYVSSGLGSISQTADPSSLRYNSGYTVYRLSKTALNMWAIQEYKELKDKGVKVFIMCPGLVRSNLRGKTEDKVSAGGHAQDPTVSGQTILSIAEGKRDADAGKFVHKDGLYEW